MSTTGFTFRTLLTAGVSLGLASCNFEVPSSSYLSHTKLISVVVEVVELGPLNPGRIGVPSAAPIAEPMPHDRVAFDAVVVDADGRRLPAEELETMWFQCGVYDCSSIIYASVGVAMHPCDEPDELGLSPTTDSICRLGRGNGRFEFTVPELGQQLSKFRVAQYYGVIAWDGRSAESCWAARQGDDGIENCAFIQRSVKVGPSWWMLVYADSIGLTTVIPIHQIAAGVLIQPANRVPIVNFVVAVDGEYAGTWPEATKFQAALGSRIEISAVYDPTSQFLQSYFRAERVGEPESETFLFTAATEILFETAYSSNAIHAVERDPSLPEYVALGKHEFVVDEYAKPETSRIWLVYFDDRFGEGVASFEFEVTP